MQKLTKEQAGWLIKQINEHASKNIHLERFSHFQLDVLEGIINQCTEKEFSGVHIRPEHDTDEECVKIDYIHCDNSSEKDSHCIRLFSLDEYTHFTRTEFKEFVLQCNKIVEWLDEQES